MVQFCARQYSFVLVLHTSYPTHDIAAALALAHHVARAFANTTTRQLPGCREVELSFSQSRAELRAEVVMFVAAM
jgi:hypothetical protein